MVLIGLLFNYFMINFIRFPNHIIRVRKQDVTYIETINFLYDYSEVKLTSSSIIDLSNIVTLSNLISIIRSNSNRVYMVFNKLCTKH